MTQTETQQTMDCGPRYAPYACLPDEKNGKRLHEEANVEASDSDVSYRDAFAKDLGRFFYSDILHRLGKKTQVFAYPDSDHLHTRSTHSHKVAYLTEAVCNALGLNATLGRTIALAHDLGHPPFGHVGEEALDKMMKPYGGFDHNAQAIRVLTQLEKSSVAYPGCNMTWAVLEGVAKHNGKVENPPRALAEYNKIHDLELNTYASAEAQVAALCDDIAYLSHDFLDAFRKKVLNMEQLKGLPFVEERIKQWQKIYPEADEELILREALDDLIGHMVADLIETTRKNLETHQPKDAEEIRNLDEPIAAFSSKVSELKTGLKTFSKQHIYHNPKVLRQSNEGAAIIKKLLENYMEYPRDMGEEWGEEAVIAEGEKKALLVKDYIAGMTDEFAIKSYRRHVLNAANFERKAKLS